MTFETLYKFVTEFKRTSKENAETNYAPQQQNESGKVGEKR